MQSRRVADIDSYLDPAAAVWSSEAANRIDMIPAPLGLQPTDHIIATWENRPYGEAEWADLKSVHDGETLAVHISWSCAKISIGASEGFPDAAAIAFPVRGEPILLSMGSSDAPMHMLQWKAKGNETRSVLAEGIGSSLPGPSVSENGKGGWSQGIWSVVFSRSLNAPENASPLSAGMTTLIGVAVWNGTNEERAGIKAVSGDWTDFILEA